MPPHPDRVRRNYEDRGCLHSFLVYANSDIAAFIECNGDRTTIHYCILCGYQKRYTRSQSDFLDELNRMNFYSL